MAAERARSGVDHCGVGFMAARVWQLPRALGEVIRFHHHHSPLGDKISQQGKRLLRIVQQADSLSHLMLQRADELDQMDEPQLERELASSCICPTWGDTPLDAESLADVLPFAQERSQVLISALGLGAD